MTMPLSGQSVLVTGDLSVEDSSLRRVFSERERSLYAIARPSVCLSVVCLSVTLVHSTQPVKIFGNFSSPSGTLAIH